MYLSINTLMPRINWVLYWKAGLTNTLLIYFKEQEFKNIVDLWESPLNNLFFIILSK